jgi:alpha-ketoglutarate-dependent taurine dioxygenase
MRPEFAYVHHWQMHDMLLWDNNRTMHWAMGYPAQDTRVVKRTTLKGHMLTGKLLSELEAA